MTKQDPGKARMVLIGPHKPVHEMTDEDWLEVGRELFDAIQQRRADDPNDPGVTRD